VSTVKVLAREVTAESFAPFGKVHAFGLGQPADDDGSLVVTAGDGWNDAFTAKPLISTNGSLGVTQGPAAPFSTRQMERHLLTEEALFPADAPLVLAVAAPTDAAAPQAADIRAFVINPGTAVVLHEGTWHDACRGAGGETHYYWMATCGLEGSTWTDVDSGPVRVELAPEDETGND